MHTLPTLAIAAFLCNGPCLGMYDQEHNSPPKKETSFPKDLQKKEGEKENEENSSNTLSTSDAFSENIGGLPNEVWDNTFRFLVADELILTSPTCKIFDVLAKQKWMKNGLVGNKGITPLQLSEILLDSSLHQYEGSIEKIRLRNEGDEPITSFVIRFLVKCPHLTGLDLSSSNITEGCLLCLPGTLTELNLSSLKITSTNLQAIAQRCSNLKILNLEGSSLPEKASESLCGMSLTTLNLGLTDIVSDDLKYLKEMPLLVLNLSKIDDTADIESRTTITGEGIGNLPPNLESLSLRGCKLTDRDLQEYFPTLSCLKDLNLSSCNQITGVALQTVAQKCPSLTSLNLQACPGITGADLKHLPKRLNILNIAHCGKIEGPDLECFPELRELTELTLGGGETQTSYRGLEHIAKGCPKLAALELRNICVLGEELELLKGLPIIFLSLSFCPWVTDDGLRVIAESCPGLTFLNLDGCEGITGNGLKHLTSLKSLTSLYLREYENYNWEESREHKKITDGDLQFLLGNYPKLNILCLEGCINITGSGLQFLPNNLTALSLYECKNITDISFIAKSCPELTILNLSGCDKSMDLFCLKELICLKTLVLPDGTNLRGKKLWKFLSELAQ